MAGLLDPTEDIVTPDERKAITQQNLFSTLLQSGMNLVAAGENLYPWQRAQMIAQAAQPFGAMPGNNQQMLANAAQMKLVSQKAADKKREDTILSSPEFKEALSKLPPEMQALARINPQAAISAITNNRQLEQQAAQAKAAADREAARQAAIDARQPPKVEKDEYGRLVAYDPATKEWKLVNMGAGGDMRGAYGLPGGQPGAGPQGAADLSVQGAGPVPAGAAPTVNVDPTADYSRVFGPTGFYHAGANIVRGVLDGPTDANVKAANSQSNWDQIRLNTIKALATEMPGRNSKYTAQEVAKTLPESASFFTSPQMAVSKIDAAQRTIEGEIASLESAFNAPGNIQARAKIAENLRDLYRSKENLKAVNEKLVAGMQGESQQRTPAAGLPDGATIVGKTQDGRTVYERNGQRYVK
jgi:hypothetical protein